MSNITQHRTRIRRRYNYSKGSLEKGMIVEMTYKRRKKKGEPSNILGLARLREDTKLSE